MVKLHVRMLLGRFSLVALHLYMSILSYFSLIEKELKKHGVAHIVGETIASRNFLAPLIMNNYILIVKYSSYNT